MKTFVKQPLCSFPSQADARNPSKTTAGASASSLTFTYPTSYRCYTLAKIGFCFAFLWYVLDFFRIHLALWNKTTLLLPSASEISFSGISSLDEILRPLAVFVSGKAMVWTFLFCSPVAATLYLWGKGRWLQFVIGCWMSFSMISLSSLVGVFNSSADIWVHYVFLTYSLSALICPTAEWNKIEPGLTAEKWRANPTVFSTYAWLVVLVQFTVYFYAGVNKLVFGWTPWITGTALQNLAFDSSMHDFVAGISIPHWLSFLLCYLTLFQRLIVPFGFYSERFRFWSWLILASMHAGYAILMKVEIFPLIGIASLFMVLPSRTLKQHLPTKIRPRTSFTTMPLWKRAAICLISFWLLLEPARLTFSRPVAWENKFMMVPSWRMFADGGVTAGGKWRLVFTTPDGEVDATQISLHLLPQLWRDRFYIDLIYHALLVGNSGPGSLPEQLSKATETAYKDQQLRVNANPVVLDSGFDVFRRNSAPQAR